MNRRFKLLGAALTLMAPVALHAQAPETATEANRPAPPSTTTVTTSGNPSTRTTITHTDPGNMRPPPASAEGKSYPVCSRTVTDACQNPGEGGAPGRSRALDHWPGEPASAMKKPG